MVNWETCPTCKGAGTDPKVDPENPDLDAVRCQTCDGLGQIIPD